MSLVTYQVDPKIVADVRTCIYIVKTRDKNSLFWVHFVLSWSVTTRWSDSVHLVSGIVPDGLLLWNGDAAHPYSRVLLADSILISIWRSKWSTPCLLVIFTGCDSHFVLILWEYKSKTEKNDLEIQNNYLYTLCEAMSPLQLHRSSIPFHSIFENVGLESPNSFVQVDHQVDISHYLYYSRESAYSTSSLMYFGSIRLLTSRTLNSNSFHTYNKHYYEKSK